MAPASPGVRPAWAQHLRNDRARPIVTPPSTINSPAINRALRVFANFAHKANLVYIKLIFENDDVSK